MNDEYVGEVYIVSPVDEEGEPMELYFTVTQDGYLLHMEKMDVDIPKETVASEMAKLLHGLESSTGRFNEFVKNRNNYKIRMALGNPRIKVSEAREMDSAYRMTKEERIRAIEKEKEKWLSGL